MQLSQLAYGGQLGPCRELPAGDEPSDLLDELPIDRRAGLRIQDEHVGAYFGLCVSLH